MRANGYTVSHQHEPLRTPDGWTGQNKMLVAQLEEMLDDIYKRLGKLKDADKTIDESITTLENSAATLGSSITALESRIVVSAEEPASPASGMIWVRPGEDAEDLTGWKTADVFVHE